MDENPSDGYPMAYKGGVQLELAWRKKKHAMVLRVDNYLDSKSKLRMD